MPAQHSDTPSDLPPSLRSFLTVTNSDGTPRTAHVEPSSLLSRIEAFLPQLKAANETLTPQQSSQSVVQLKKVAASPENEDKGDEVVADRDEGDMRINMDLYVDNSLGTLVPNDGDADGEQDPKGDDTARQQRKRPLIEVLSQEDALSEVQLPSKKLAKDNAQCALP